MKFSSIFQWIAGYRSVAMQLLTVRRGLLVGQDSFGNRYYRDRQGRRAPFLGGRERRWVLYTGLPEGSTITSQWHAWLHHTVDELPEDSPVQNHSWQQPHNPNLTGSPAAYRPPGHTLSGNQRDKATGDYEAWIPK